MLNLFNRAKKTKSIVLMITLLIIVGFLVISFLIFYTQKKIEVLKNKQMQQEKIHFEKKLANLIDAKRKSVMSIPILISKDIALQEYLEHKRRDLNLKKLLEDMSFSLRKYTDYKNVWLHLIDKNGISLAKSWTTKVGDSVSFRKDVREMIKSPHVISGLSIGKYSLTLKSMVPIFNDKKEFLGIVEGVTHCNSIIKKLKKDGVESLVIADKKYKSQLIHNITHTFIDDYYVVNFNPNKKIIKLVKEKGIKYFISNKNYKIYKDYLTITYPLKNIKGETIGYYILFENQKNLNNKKINKFVYEMIISFICIFLVLVIIFSILYKNRLKIESQRKYFEEILNTTKDMIIITNLNKIIDANRTFLEFFNVKSTEEFYKLYHCICDLFVEEKDYLSGKVNNQHWIKYIINNPYIEHKIKILFNNKVYYFSIKVQKLNNEDNELYTAVLSDITQMEIYQQKLKKLSVTDALTGIGNRAFFDQNIKKEINRAKRYKTPLSLAMFDLDFFKNVNDTYGHDVGDIVLKKITNTVKQLLRNTDIFCRYGGEEFMIIMPETSLNEAIISAERIRKHIEKLQIPPVKQITISIGVTELKDDDTVETFVKRVDDALYKSKQNGRNQVNFL